MSDPYPAPEATPARSSKPAAKSLLDRLLSLVRREPEDREGIKAVLEAAHERQLLDAESYKMIKGALAVSEGTVGDIMVPRSRMDLLDVTQPIPYLVASVIETAHSRFPVYEGDRDNIIGILLAKDLLRFYTDEGFDVRDMLRPAVFIPESKRLNVLLRDFRVNRNHIAIVVDEYGGVAGLITIEDVLEQIVGDIEDEYDFDQEEDNILPTADGHMRVRGLTEISQFNEAFGTQFSDEDVDTIGGLLSNHLGRVPHRGEKIVMGSLQFDVLRADARQVQVLLVRRVASPAGGSAAAASSGSNPA